MHRVNDRALFISALNKENLDAFAKRNPNLMAKDKDGNPVFLAESAWGLQMAQENFPKVIISFQSEV